VLPITAAKLEFELNTVQCTITSANNIRKGDRA